jgi:tetratricopeptide (TPR) repeat protein
MPLQDSEDFGAITESITGKSQVHSHFFESANSAIRYMNKLKPDPNNDMLHGALTVDVFGIKKEGDITGELIAPLDKTNVAINSGKKYLIETVIKTVKLGHPFTQGTGDSNQVWVELNVFHEGKLVGMSGGVDENGIVDDWSYFINVYMLDNQGNRIDRRNVENIFTPLYNHSIPPGAGSVVHYGLDIPEELTGELTIQAKVFYRKFDTNYYRLFTEDETRMNDLPIVTLATDVQKINVSAEAEVESESIVLDQNDWKRWNDFGIGLLRSQSYKQAEFVFKKVAEMGRAEGWINLTRAYIQQGRLIEASEALNKASQNKEFRYTWQLAYFAGVIDLQNGFIEKALDNFTRVYHSEFQNAQEANFDFSKDYKFVTLYAQTAFQRSKMLQGNEQLKYQQKSLKLYNEVLGMDPEWVDAHFGLTQVYAALGDVESSKKHKSLHEKYKQDDNSRDTVIAIARSKNKAADHAAENIAIYQLDKLEKLVPVSQYIKNNSIKEE